MKFKSLFAILLVLTLSISIFIVPTSAKETNDESVEIIIIGENVSAETKAKIEKYFANGEPATDDGATTYGLTCTLLGHKLECSKVATVTHKVRASSPRCLKKYYSYEACTRCDYESSQVTSSEYIICCS